MQNPHFPKDLIDLLDCDSSDFFLTDRVDQFELEIYYNCIYINLTKAESAKISADDLLEYTGLVKADRRSKLRASNINSHLIYYIWHDPTVGYLRLMFINSNHKVLPFRGVHNFVDNERAIIDEFLAFDFPETNDYEGFSELINDDDVEDITLNVYRQDILRSFEGLS